MNRVQFKLTDFKPDIGEYFTASIKNYATSIYLFFYELKLQIPSILDEKNRIQLTIRNTAK